MSGHSKWSTIKRQKGTNDAKRGQTFTKLANVIALAARESGVGDVDSSPRLRMAVDSARAVNMPKENIQRAIDRGLGKLPGQTLEEVAYEGFGPGKVAFYIEAVTDNKLRTTSEIRNMFDRSGGNMGTSGVTAYLFDKKGEIKVSTKGGDKDEEELELIDTGAEDVVELSLDGHQEYLIYTQPSQLNEVSNKITQLGYRIDSAELMMEPNVTVNITDSEAARKVVEFTEKVEDHDDVQKVFANFEIADELLT